MWNAGYRHTEVGFTPGDFGDGDLLPLWVADMEIQSPSVVREALTERVKHGVFWLWKGGG